MSKYGRREHSYDRVVRRKTESATTNITFLKYQSKAVSFALAIPVENSNRLLIIPTLFVYISFICNHNVASRHKLIIIHDVCNV